MTRKFEIGSKSHVNIKWNVKSIDYSRQKEEDIKSSFAKKYNISKDRITVEPVYIKKKTSSTDDIIDYGLTHNIQDPKFQHELFKQYLEENEVKDYDFDEILKIDDIINNEIDYDTYDKKRKYIVKWLKWDNFMSYGQNNYVDFTDLNGIVLLTSYPANQGGKSTFSIDLLRFLLFGKITSREDDWTLSNLFNTALPEATSVVVEGCISINDTDYVIKRTVTRPALSKRTAKSKVSQKINYYKLINDSELVELYDDNTEILDGSSTTETNKIIKETIGNERDFDLMICVNGDNLKKLISMHDTDRGRLISRWIGLLPLEEKDKIARERFNKEISKNLISNKYDKDELESNIKAEKDAIETYNNSIKENTRYKEKAEENIRSLTATRDTLMQSKNNIDESLTKIDAVTLQMSLDTIKTNGAEKRKEIELLKSELAEIGDIEFNEKEYQSIDEKCIECTSRISGIKTEIRMLKAEIESLKKSEFCPTCGAKLQGVDNSSLISEKEKRVEVLITDGINTNNLLNSFTEKKNSLSELRQKYNDKIKIQLKIDKAEVDIENLLAKYKEKNRTLKEIERNKELIEKNNKIDATLNNTNISLSKEQQYLKDIEQLISGYNYNISTANKTIKDCEKIIAVMKEEEKLISAWKLYLELIGKNGISKMVIRNTLPFINGNLKNLLNGICDFDVEVDIDDHNDVAFYIIHNDAKRKLGSGSGFEQTVASIALRSVLSKISTFSKPSFVVFDEVLVGVAHENYEYVKKLYDKIVKDYAFIFFITHDEMAKEWGDRFITVKKENDISTISKN